MNDSNLFYKKIHNTSFNFTLNQRRLTENYKMGQKAKHVSTTRPFKYTFIIVLLYLITIDI